MEDVKGMWDAEMNDGDKVWGALKSVLSNRGLGINVKKCLYDGIILWGSGMGDLKCWKKESESSWDEVFKKFDGCVSNSYWNAEVRVSQIVTGMKRWVCLK